MLEDTSVLKEDTSRIAEIIAKEDKKSIHFQKSQLCLINHILHNLLNHWQGQKWRADRVAC